MRKLLLILALYSSAAAAQNFVPVPPPPLATQLTDLTGSVTIGGNWVFNGTIYSTATPSISATYAFTTINLAQYFSSTAVSTSVAEQTAAFRMISSQATTSSAAYKSAFGMETICSAGGFCWAATTALTISTGFNYTPTGGARAISFEVDCNNNGGTNAADTNIGIANAPMLGCLYITGASSNQWNFGIAVSGSSNIRNGLLFPTGGPVSNDILTFDSAQNVINDQGSHINGVSLAGTYSGNGLSLSGTFSGNIINAAGYTLAGTGITYIYPNLPATYPATNHVGVAITSNFSNGRAETDFFNTWTTASTSSFLWYQMTGAGAASQLMALSPAGVLDALGGYAKNGVAGVTCTAGTMAIATMTTSGGIVTHC